MSIAHLKICEITIMMIYIWPIHHKLEGLSPKPELTGSLFNKDAPVYAFNFFKYCVPQHFVDSFCVQSPAYLTMRTLLRCLVFWTIIDSSYNRNSRNQKQKPTKDPDKPGDISILRMINE